MSWKIISEKKKRYIRTSIALIKYTTLFVYNILFNRSEAIVSMWMMQDQIRFIKNWSMGRAWYDDGKLEKI